MNLKAIPTMLSLVPSVARGVRQSDLQTIKKIVREAFPTVKQISGEALSELLSMPGQRTLLIDVRAPVEFAVSQLRDAINVQSPEQIAQAIHQRQPAQTILYCSVGFRSSQVARRLSARLVDDVFNLEGSIFEWANKGRPLYRGDAEARRVHPYGKRRAGLLASGLASGG